MDDQKQQLTLTFELSACVFYLKPCLDFWSHDFRTHLCIVGRVTELTKISKRTYKNNIYYTVIMAKKSCYREWTLEHNITITGLATPD